VGRQGLAEAAGQCLRKAHYLHDRLLRELPVRALAGQPFFHEFPLLLPKPAGLVLERMEEEGIFAGLPLGHLAPELCPAQTGERAILVAVTEKRTRAELDRYVEALGRALR